MPVVNWHALYDQHAVQLRRRQHRVQQHARAPSIQVAQKTHDASDSSESSSESDSNYGPPGAASFRSGSKASHQYSSPAAQSYSAGGGTDEALTGGSGGASNLPKAQNEPSLPTWKYWLGLVIYAVTNVGFLQLFEFCSSASFYPSCSSAWQLLQRPKKPNSRGACLMH